MLQFDQESGQPTRRGVHGLSGTASTAGRAFDELARNIEETQRQQAETMAHILERLRAIESGRTQSPAAPAPRRAFLALDDNGDEPWDPDTAEALTQSYESSPEPRGHPRGPLTRNQQDWIGERFGDLTRHITQALAELKTSSATTLLEERLDGFQKLISSALADVVRRSDLEGMRLIEVHVNELGDKLDELERHVSRIDGIEADVRNVIEQVSDARISKLLDYDARFAADLEAVARRAAEEVHTRFGHAGAPAQTDTGRHEELRALIEASIRDRREADAQAASLVTGLTGRVSDQSDRYDDLKGLLEQAIQEQRQNEQTAFSMLDTLQQALVTVLDRMDVLEQGQQHVALAAPYSGELAPPPPPFEATIPSERTPEPFVEPTSSADAAYGFRDTRYDAFARRGADPAPTVEVPAAFTSAAPDVTAASASYDGNSDETDSPVDRMRRDFVADARRAKMKAAANRAEAAGEKDKPEEKTDPVSQARATLTQGTREPPIGTAPGGRLFGMSTKLLAGVLALIVAINGGLLLLNRKGSLPFASQIAHPAVTEQLGATGSTQPAPNSQALEASDLPAGAATGPRSDLGSRGAAGMVPQPYGYSDDVLDPPEVETMGNTVPEAPLGTTIARPAGSLPDEAVAGVYEQQVLASLSGKLGNIVAGHSAEELLPEQGGRIEAAYPQAEVAPAEEGAEGKNALDLPPATVGPLSLRMAAANGDASAEFEVAARLAEGNGTGQNYAEALRWYQRSAAKGFAQAQYRVGTLYERGLGVAKDLERAKVWYSRAAENGNVKSMHNLAVLISGGEQGEPDYAAAAPWFLKAAEHGLADSQYNLGVLLENGLGGKADRVAAYKWYALAAKNGDQDATQRRDTMKPTLKAAELASAEEMITGFRARPASPIANDARAAGEDWKKRVNNDTNTY